MAQLSTFTFGTAVPGPIPQVRPRVEAALKAEGFGILTEIDVQATLKAKLDVDRTPMVILGACNPRLANAAIEADAAVGTLLPCNVVLREQDGGTLVEIIDPLMMLGVVDAPDVQPIAHEARERLDRVVVALTTD